MNLDAKWDKEMTPKDQEEVLNETTPGHMPPCIDKYVRIFFKKLLEEFSEAMHRQ